MSTPSLCNEATKALYASKRAWANCDTASAPANWAVIPSAATASATLFPALERGDPVRQRQHYP
eukprot:5836501-Alexandrium_andersonii.AAC.1